MTFVELLKVIFLGIVEGVTEWLPISSTGHMLLVDEFLHMEQSPQFMDFFIVAIQLGAILAVVIIFWNRLFPFRFREKPAVRTDIFLMWFKVAIACLPSAVAALAFDDYVEANFSTPVVIAGALVVYGVLFILVERWNRARTPRTSSADDITWLDALAIGIFQVLSIIPGTSRSGATIIGALMIGVSRTAAAEFTFFLSVPTMIGASLFKLMKFGFDFTTPELITLLVGMAVAFAVSLVVIRFLMDYIKKHDFKVFGWYRIALGALVLLYFFVLR